jgi:WD40 repeat protein
MTLSEPDSPGEFRIPDHTLVRRIGHGSSGEVWLARSAVTGGYHAVKIIRRANFADVAPYLRELKGIQKFEPISRSHPGFVNILHVGQNLGEGYFYYTMELADAAVPGVAPDNDQYQVKALDRLIREGRRLSVDHVLELGLRLSDALHHLHEAGLVHRDIKPSNLLFVAGRPKLADIGLVTDEDDAQSLVGTPGYIPPEGPGSRQADVFAFGKVLYECLTGLDRSQFPDLPTFFDGDPDQQRFLELNEIVIKACHQDLRHRYQTARQLHGDLIAVENGKSVIRLRELEFKLSRLKRIARIGAVALLAIGLVGFVVQREFQNREEDRQRSAGMLVGNFVQSLEQGDYAEAMRNAAKVIQLQPSKEAEAINRLRFGTMFGQMPRLTLLQSLDAEVISCAFGQNDSRLIVGLSDGRCEVRNADSGEVVAKLVGHSNQVNAVVASSDGKRILTASRDGTARIWDFSTARLLQVLHHYGQVICADFSSDGKRVATGGADGIIRLWDSESGECLWKIKGHTDQVSAVRFSRSGQLLASGSWDNTARIWQPDKGEPLGEAIKHASWVVNVAFSPDDLRLATACSDHAAYVWSVQSHNLVLAPLKHERGVRRAEFTPDGSAIVTAGWDSIVSIWNSVTGDLEPPRLPHSSPLIGAGVSASGNRLVTGCSDGTLRVWDRAGQKSPRRVEAESVSSDGSSFIRCAGNAVEVFSMESPGKAHLRINTPAPIRSAFFSDAGTLIGTIETNRHLRVWSATSGQPRSPALPLASSSARARIDPTGTRVTVLEHNNSLSIYHVASGERVCQPIIKSERIDLIGLSPDGNKLALVSSNQVEIRQMTTGNVLFPLFTQQFKVSAVVFSPDSRRIAICTTDLGVGRSCYAEVTDLSTGQSVGRKLWHRDGVLAAAWSADGQRLITVSEDGTGRIWSIRTGEVIGRELHHREQVLDLDLRSNPQLAVTSSADGTARIWNGENGEPVSPVYHFPAAAKRVWLSPESTRFIGEGVNSVIWMQEIHCPKSPPTDLLSLADVLSGHSPLYGQADEFAGAKALAARWRELRSIHPEWFSVSNVDLSAWRHANLTRFRDAKQRRFELFHVKEALRLNPGNTNAIARKKRLDEILAHEVETR